MSAYLQTLPCCRSASGLNTRHGLSAAKFQGSDQGHTNGCAPFARIFMDDQEGLQQSWRRQCTHQNDLEISIAESKKHWSRRR
mmetsp:Transcript_27692/g.85607  ORF Transcript_27692/g.85607 Transcript_27692/m.85607 type:complete len:83 (-) Transcript_27692:344-592(-)